MSGYEHRYSHAPTGFGDISIHHIPNYAAASVIALMTVDSIGLGAVLADVCSHLRYDWRLLSSPGWRSPLQIVCRLAYFICRYGAIANLSISVLVFNLPNMNCDVVFACAKWTLLVPCCMIDVMFFTRTAVLMGNSPFIVIPLLTLFFSFYSLAVYCVLYWGSAVRIPNTTFCAFRSTPRDVEPFRSIFLAYYVLTTLTHSLVFISTVWVLARKVKRQSVLSVLKLAFLRHSQTTTNENNDKQHNSNRLACTLLVQSFVLYGLLESTKLALVFTHYFTNNQTAWSNMVFGVHMSVGAITVGYLLRQTSYVMRGVQKSNSGGRSNSASTRSGTKDHRTSSFNRSAQTSSSIVEETLPRRPEALPKIEGSAPSLQFDLRYTANRPTHLAPIRNNDYVYAIRPRMNSTAYPSMYDTDIECRVMPPDNRVVFLDCCIMVRVLLLECAHNYKCKSCSLLQRLAELLR